MARFSRAIGICDRCGMEYKYTTLQFQVVARKLTSTLVCGECLDEDQPQWFPATGPFNDPVPLPNARPEQNIEAVYSGFAWGPVGGLGTTLTCGVAYDFDLEDRPISTADTDVLVQEDDGLLVQEDESVILT